MSRVRQFAFSSLDLGFGIIDGSTPVGQAHSLESLLGPYLAVLTDDDRSLVKGLPALREARSNKHLIVLETTAYMTAHAKDAPRLRNEFEGAVDSINSSDPEAVAGGLVLVNAAYFFYSPIFRDNGRLEPRQRALSIIKWMIQIAVSSV